jgi:hypothetical protein
VQLLSEAQLHDLTAAGMAVEASAPASLTDRRRQLVGRDGQAGGAGAVLGVVEADDRVEVHQAPQLKLRDLRVRDPQQLSHLALAEASVGRKHADELNDEAVPQRRGMPVPQHRPLIVIRRRVDRGAEQRVVLGMAATAATRAAIIRPVVDRSEAWRGQRRENLRMLGDLLGDALAAAATPA